jgi:hypothetical protein
MRKPDPPATMTAYFFIPPAPKGELIYDLCLLFALCETCFTLVASVFCLVPYALYLAACSFLPFGCILYLLLSFGFRLSAFGCLACSLQLTAYSFVFGCFASAFPILTFQKKVFSLFFITVAWRLCDTTAVLAPH